MKGITLEKHKSMIYFIYDLDTLIGTIDGYKPKRDTIERYGFQYGLDTLETVVECTDTHVNMFWHGHRLTQRPKSPHRLARPSPHFFFCWLGTHSRTIYSKHPYPTPTPPHRTPARIVKSYPSGGVAPESYRESYRSGGVAPESYRKSYRSGGVAPESYGKSYRSGGVAP